jgi:hypothetical protein
MDDQNRFRILGRTGLKVGRLGVACSYGAPTAAFEEAFEQGVNYFYWGSRRKASMARAIRNINGVLPFCHVTSSRGCLYVRAQEHRRNASSSQSLTAWRTVGR